MVSRATPAATFLCQRFFKTGFDTFSYHERSSLDWVEETLAFLDFKSAWTQSSCLSSILGSVSSSLITSGHCHWVFRLLFPTLQVQFRRLCFRKWTWKMRLSGQLLVQVGFRRLGHMIFSPSSVLLSIWHCAIQPRKSMISCKVLHGRSSVDTALQRKGVFVLSLFSVLGRGGVSLASVR